MFQFRFCRLDRIIFGLMLVVLLSMPSEAASLQPGDKVAAPWGGGLYLGTVQAVKGESADVLYADDKQIRPVAVKDLRLIEPQDWQVADKVLAVWSTGKFYQGTIQAKKSPDLYTVKWDDGSAPSDVSVDKIIAAGGPKGQGGVVGMLKSWTLQPGSSVAAPWGGGLYLGTVQSVTGDTAEVLYADDKQVRKVAVKDLRLIRPQSWQVGDKVLAVWSTGKFYNGTIQAEKGPGRYLVKWDDGSAPSEVETAKIMAP